MRKSGWMIASHAAQNLITVAYSICKNSKLPPHHFRRGGGYLLDIMTTTTLDTHVQVPPAVLFRNLEGEAVLLNVETGHYYGLDGVGTRMWQSLSQSGSVEQTYTALLQEYNVTPERLQTDLLVFVDKLCDKSLLLRVDSTGK